MKNFLALGRYEFKNIRRDKMTGLMAVYPIFITLIGAYVIPSLFNLFDGNEAAFLTTSLVIAIIMASLAPMLGGAMLGFLLLDHKDEKTLDSLRVTPLSLRNYLIFKSVYTYILSASASALVIFGIRILSGESYTFMGQNAFRDLPVSGILFYALVGGLFGPLFGLLMASLAKNKIEGTAYMESLGVLLLVPVLVMIEAFQDIKQYMLGIIPGFWPVKGLLESASILENEANLPAFMYFIIGSIYMLIMIGLLTYLFQKNISE